MTDIPARAFAVQFAKLSRWDPMSFHRIHWHWPDAVMAPIGYVMRPRKEKVDRAKFSFHELQPITIHFDGSIGKRSVDAGKVYSMDLFFARPGDIVVAKIDLKNGAVGIVPEWKNVAVTGHFAVYEPDRARIVPEYLALLIQAPFFKANLWRNKVGAEGRKEVKLDFFEAIRIPLPSLAVQQAVLAEWQKARQEIAATEERIRKIEPEIEEGIHSALGTPLPGSVTRSSRVMGLWWNEIGRWSFNYLSCVRKGLLGFQKSRFPIVPLGQGIEDTRNGFCIKPVSDPTPHKMLKLSALTTAGLDLSETKYVKVSDKTAEQFHIREGDLLICRSNALEYVAKSVYVREDHPEVLYPDTIIRVKCGDLLSPEFACVVLQTALGRSFFQINSRRAVGGMWKISADDIRTCPIPLPPLDVQRRIVADVEAGRARIGREREKARVLSRQIEADVEAYLLGTKKVGTS